MEKLKTDVVDLVFSICDLDVNPNCLWDFEGRFIYCNKLFADLLGYRRREIIGTEFVKLMHPGDVKRSIDVYDSNTESGVNLVHNFYNRYYRKDGTVIFMCWLKGWNNSKFKIGGGQAKEVTESEYKKQGLNID